MTTPSSPCAPSSAPTARARTPSTLLTAPCVWASAESTLPWTVRICRVALPTAALARPLAVVTRLLEAAMAEDACEEKAAMFCRVWAMESPLARTVFDKLSQFFCRFRTVV